MLRTVYSEEEASTLMREGYKLISVNVVHNYRWDSNGDPQPDEDILAYTMVCKFMEGINNE